MSHFYCHTAHLLLLALTNRSSLKAITSSKCPLSEYSQADQRRYLATLISCLSWRSALDEVLTSSNIWKANDVKSNREVAKVLGSPWRKYCEGQLQNNSKGPQSSSSQQSDPLNFRDSTAAMEAHHMLLLVLVHDLLIPGKRLSLASTSTIGKFLSGHKARMSAELVKLQIKRGKRTVDELKEAEPGEGEGEGRWKRGRWIRVNRLNSSMSEVCQWLQEHGYEQLEGDHIPLVKSSQSGLATQSKKKSALNRAFICPPASSHPPDLLLLPMEATADLVASELYTQGKIILQDAASCWPAWLLLHPLLSQTSAHITVGTGKKRRRIKQSIHVLDATAAPGNKTSHLSSMLAQLPDPSAYESISLTALERDPQRFKTLVSQLRRAGALATNKDRPNAGLVTPYKLDFLSLSPEDSQWRLINRMILDPSCSGSGITGRLDWLTKKTRTSSDAIAQDEVEEEASDEVGEEEGRLQRLADMQLKMIEHAFQFPNLERLVYSTCSIHHIEDEGVVARALSSRFASSHTSPLGPLKGTHWHWELAGREECLPGWNWRGEDHEGISNAAGMMRAYPYAKIEDQDTESSGVLGTHILRTNGFFAACFVKVFHPDDADGEEAEKPNALDAKRKRSSEDADIEDQDVDIAQATMTANAKRNRKKKEAKARQKARAKAEQGGQ